MARFRTRPLTRILAAAGSLSAAAFMLGGAPPANAATGPYAELHNFQNSSYCLSVKGGGGPGSIAVILLCNGSKNQQWALANQQGSGLNTSWQLKNEDGWCLGIDGGGSAKGTKLAVAKCVPPDQDANEYCQPYLNTNGTLGMLNYVDCYGEDISVAGGLMVAGQPVTEAPYNGDFNQYWTSLTDL